MIIVDYWKLSLVLVVLSGFWLFFALSWLFLKVIDGFCWVMVVPFRFLFVLAFFCRFFFVICCCWLFWLVLWGFWWLLAVIGGSCWFLLVIGDSPRCTKNIKNEKNNQNLQKPPRITKNYKEPYTTTNIHQETPRNHPEPPRTANN